MSEMISRGKRDLQSVVAGGARCAPPRIEGVRIVELGNVLTRSGWMMEVYRTDWAVGGNPVRQVNWVELNPSAVTDWHCHGHQIDHLIGVGGPIKLALWDDRDGSPTQGATEIVRMGALRPVMTIVPPGVWHALRNESGVPAGYLNIIDQLYAHENPDNFRPAAGVTHPPDIL
jgi:dTDP-4-dehydrorhamnose 3,5-epimerase